MNNNYNALKKVKCFLLDMDGTIYLDNVLFEGVKETLAKMKEHGRFIFLTNNSSKSKEVYIQKLHNLGIDITSEEIYTSGMACVEYLNEFYQNKSVYLLGTKALQEEFISGGITLTDNNPDLVVLGYDTELTYEKLVKFTNFLNEGKPFIATHPDINCPASPYFVPDIGAMMEMIYASTKRRPDLIIGKPYTIMGENIMRKYGLASDEIAMVGDRLYTDIAFANHNNFVSILVLSGETSKEEANASPVKEDIIEEKISDLIKNL